MLGVSRRDSSRAAGHLRRSFEVFLVERHAAFAEKLGELVTRIFLPVMLFLPGNVIPHYATLRGTHRKSSVSFLPEKLCKVVRGSKDRQPRKGGICPPMSMKKPMGGGKPRFIVISWTTADRFRRSLLGIYAQADTLNGSSRS